jgi:hypothetical protein
MEASQIEMKAYGDLAVCLEKTAATTKVGKYNMNQEMKISM